MCELNHPAMVLMLLLASVVAGVTFKDTESEVLRDEENGRIRGIRSRDKSFVLGGLFPVHLPGAPCGEVRLLGAELVEAMLFAIDTINADPDLLPGVELGYDIRDTCMSETLGLDEAVDLIFASSTFHTEDCDAPPNATTNKVEKTAVPTTAIVGAEVSRVSVPVASLGRLFQMPQVSYASTSPLLSDRTRYSYFYRTVPADDQQVLAMVDILQHFGWNYVSILHTEDTYGSAGISAFVNASAKNGICIDIRRGIQPSFSDRDYDNLVNDLRNSTAKVIIFFALQDTVREVLTRVNKDVTLKRRFTWIASDGWSHDINLVHNFNDTATGVIGVAPYTDHLQKLDEYVSNLTINSNTRNGWFPEVFAALANCTLGKDCDNDTSITSFPNYKQDLFAPLLIDGVYAIAHGLHGFLIGNCNSTDTAPFVWFKINHTCLGQTRELNGSSLLEYLSKVNFTSITNHSITFDESGSVQGFYDILNYQAIFSEVDNLTGYKFVSVGTWDSGSIDNSLSLSSVQFGLKPDGGLRTEPVESQCGTCNPGTYIREITGSCCAICEPCLGKKFSSQPKAKQCDSCLVEGEREMWGNSPLTGSNSCVLIPEISASYGDALAIPCLILTCAGIACVIITAVIIGLYWKTPIIKSSSREQMILLLLGISCSFVLPFFYVAPPSIPICLVNRLGIWFCYSFMFGALAIKVQRVARIFYGVKHNLHYTPRFSSPIYQIIFTMIIVGIQMSVIIFSLAFVHPDIERVLRHNRDGEGDLGLPEVVVLCRKENTATIVVSLFYETSIIAVATILGIFSFKFPKNFNEAKYISFCTFSLLVVWLGLIPAYFTTESQPEIQNTTISLFIILSAFGVISFIFGPKLYIVLFRPEKNTFSTKQNKSRGTQLKQRNQTTAKSETE